MAGGKARGFAHVPVAVGLEPQGLQERKVVHDAEFRFLVTAREDKLFARWAGARVSMSGERGEALVEEPPGFLPPSFSGPNPLALPCNLRYLLKHTVGSTFGPSASHNALISKEHFRTECDSTLVYSAG